MGCVNNPSTHNFKRARTCTHSDTWKEQQCDAELGIAEGMAMLRDDGREWATNWLVWHPLCMPTRAGSYNMVTHEMVRNVCPGWQYEGLRFRFHSVVYRSGEDGFDAQYFDCMKGALSVDEWVGYDNGDCDPDTYENQVDALVALMCETELQERSGHFRLLRNPFRDGDVHVGAGGGGDSGVGVAWEPMQGVLGRPGRG